MEVSENKTVAPSSRDKILSRYKEKYPEKEYSSDDLLFNQMAEDYDEYDAKMEKYKSNEDKLAKMFASDPRSATFLGAWMDGKDPVVEFARTFGSEMVQSMNDPERLDALAEANKEYIDKLSKSKELEDEYQKNVDETLEALANDQKEKGYSDEDLKKALDYIASQASGYIYGKITPQMVEQAMIAINRDRDVAQAEHEGEVRGRNAKIMDKIKKEDKSDNLPSDLNAGKDVSGGGMRMPDLGVLDREQNGGFWEEALRQSKKNR